MKILELGFPEGPSIREASQGRVSFTRIEFSSLEQFLRLDRPETIISEKPDLLIMFPLCSSFSMASLGKHWNKLGEGRFEPKSSRARQSLMMLNQFEIIIKRVQPDKWMLENPRGMINFFWSLGERSLITHCQYGSERMKPTYIFSNYDWKPKPPCKYGDSCHLSSPRGSRNGTQGIKNRKKKTSLPIELQQAIIESLK